jgi:hypothetical protein
VAAVAVVDVPAGAGLVSPGAVGAAVAAQRRRAWTRRSSALGRADGGCWVAAVRDAEWLVALCVLAPPGLGALRSPRPQLDGDAAHARRRAGRALRALPWVARGLGCGRRRCRGLGSSCARRPDAACSASSGPARSADAAFARLVELVLPSCGWASCPPGWCSAVVAALVLGASYLAVAPPPWSRLQPPPGGAARRVEWAVPVAALDLLLLSFLAVHSTVLFGGRDHVLRTAGLTAAEYARSGFGQLLAVTALVLVVVAAAVRWAPRGDPGDVLLVRGALGCSSPSRWRSPGRR